MKLYIETSVPNMLFHDDAPDKKQVTEVFFQWLRICPHELCASPLVEQELDRAAEPKRRQLRAALVALPLVSLPIMVEAEELAEAFVVEGAIPRRFEDDALHLAIAICHRVDIVVSWNMRHLVNPRRVAMVNHGQRKARLSADSSGNTARSHEPMKTEREPKAVVEVRRIRQELQQEARRVGRRKYHAMLNRRRGWFLGMAGSMVREKPAKKYGS